MDEDSLFELVISKTYLKPLGVRIVRNPKGEKKGIAYIDVSNNDQA